MYGLLSNHGALSYPTCSSKLPSPHAIQVCLLPATTYCSCNIPLLTAVPKKPAASLISSKKIFRRQVYSVPLSTRPSVVAELTALGTLPSPACSLQSPTANSKNTGAVKMGEYVRKFPSEYWICDNISGEC